MEVIVYLEDDRFDISSDIVTRLVVGEMILVPIRKTAGDLDSIYVLRDSGRRIWEMLSHGGPCFGEMARKLSRGYGIDLDAARKDLSAFLSDLESAGLIIRTCSGGTSNSDD